MVLTLLIVCLLALTTEAKEGIHFHLKEVSNNHGADYEDEALSSVRGQQQSREDEAPGRKGNCLTGALPADAFFRV